LFRNLARVSSKMALIGWQFSVPEVCADLSKTSYPPNIPTVNILKGFLS
jgi:hypothetical protein